SGVRLLAEAGWRTAYLTPYRTAHFGLDRLLREAGFATILDQSALGRARDAALLDTGLDLLAGLKAGGPLFLHVHTTNGHLPYRVDDPERFGRFDARDDYGRYLNSI